MNTKRIEWSYPTSPNADRFHFKQGCYSVEVGPANHSKPHKAVAGFATIGEAETYAALIVDPWDRITKRAATETPIGKR